jgi:SAM-dependent methyltransferase
MSTCRACAANTEAFLPFGRLPLANALVPLDAPPERQEYFPLTMIWCGRCGLVQLAETIDPARLFRHYVYASSNSAAFLDHVGALAARLVRQRALDGRSRVIEIGSNDGYLLQYYRDADVPVLGVEPARNIAALARDRGIDTVGEFFSLPLARELANGDQRADVIHVHNVLAHVPDLADFVAALRTILKPAGIVAIEVPYLCDLVETLAFDTVYHEHVFYFSLTPLMSLFARHGMQIFAVERVPVHGGSLRLFARLAEDRPSEPSIGELLDKERAWGVGDPATYLRFADAVRAFPPVFRKYLARLRAGGASIAAYGASAKGATLLNYCGIGRDTINFVVDRSPLKHGLALPGVQVPILPVDELLRRRPDFVVILAWNFAEEIMQQQAEYRRAGGRFILPVPHPRLAA